MFRGVAELSSQDPRQNEQERSGPDGWLDFQFVRQDSNDVITGCTAMQLESNQNQNSEFFLPAYLPEGD